MSETDLKQQVNLLQKMLKMPKATEVGVCGTPRCPACRNSLGNCQPDNSPPELWLCVDCKTYFVVLDVSALKGNDRVIRAGTASATFQEGYYIQTGRGQKWADFDGPFSTPAEAVKILNQLCGHDHVAPEILNSAVIVVFKDNVLDLFKDDLNQIVNGSTVYWKKSVIYKGECLFGWPKQLDSEY